MASLSNYDQTYLNADQQAQIKALKEQYAAAQNSGATQAELDSIHQQAENVRKTAGYATGSDGTGYQKLATGQGGQTPEQVRQYLDDYNAANYDSKSGWKNGYDVDTNTRSKANYVRQQMEANSNAWHTAQTQAEKDALHAANVELADILAEYTGHSTSGKSYGYDPNTGKWLTWDANNGYGTYVGYDQPNIRKGVKEAYGYTDQQMDDWANNRSALYHNFVDASVPARNQVDESSGFTGRYADFVNGPHVAILGTGTNNANMASYSDLVGDGFNDENDYAAYILPEYDENGNIKKTAPAVKGNNGVSDYTKQFAAYTQNGVVMPNSLQVTNPGNAKATNGAYTGALGQTGTGGLQDRAGGNDLDGQRAYADLIRKNTGLSPNGVSASGGYDGYVDQINNAALLAQLERLKSTYESSLSELEADETEINDAYTEEKRRASGDAAQAAAGWREVANAYGLNSGAVGQAALAQQNQLQEELSALGRSQTAALTELQRQRTVLGQQYQAAINQAVEEYEPELAWKLYRQAMEEEAALQEQEKQFLDAASQYGKRVIAMLGGTMNGQ